MATIKAILKKDQKKDGTFPLVIRITKNGKSTYVYTEYSLLPDQWDTKHQKVKKSHPNSVRLNNYLAKLVAEAGDKAIELESNKQNVSSVNIKKQVIRKPSTEFSEQAQSYLDNLKAAGKYNRYTADKPRVAHFKEFAGDIAFQDINPSLLERFKTWLKVQYEVGDRTIINHLVVVRSVFSQAVKDGIVDPKHYPFGKGKMKIKFPDSIKIGLNADEVHSLETVELPNKTHHHARNLWLLSFYTAGMRAGDLFKLNWDSIRDGRLAYAMNKNDKTGSLKLSEKALGILEQYRDNEGLVFPELKKIDMEDKFVVQRTTAFATSRIDKILRKHVAPAAGITKKLTLHIARHTFGNLAGDKIPVQILQALYRHSNITTTMGYQQNFVHGKMDDALDSVINQVPKLNL